LPLVRQLGHRQTADHPWREGADARVEDRHDRSRAIDLSARARRNRGRSADIGADLVRGCGIGRELAHQDHPRQREDDTRSAAYLLFEAGYRNSLLPIAAVADGNDLIIPHR
jgi:hypothetical protein